MRNWRTASDALLGQGKVGIRIAFGAGVADNVAITPRPGDELYP